MVDQLFFPPKENLSTFFEFSDMFFLLTTQMGPLILFLLFLNLMSFILHDFLVLL